MIQLSASSFVACQLCHPIRHCFLGNTKGHLRCSPFLITYYCPLFPRQDFSNVDISLGARMKVAQRCSSDFLHETHMDGRLIDCIVAYLEHHMPLFVPIAADIDALGWDCVLLLEGRIPSSLVA